MVDWLIMAAIFGGFIALVAVGVWAPELYGF